MTSSNRAEKWPSVVRRLAPHLRVVSVSHPEPHLEQFNVVAMTSDADEARQAVLDLEAEEIDDARIGLVALGPSTADAATVGIAPAGVGRALIPRTVGGGAIGAAVGAGIGAAVAAITGAQASYILAAALAGALLLAVLGAFWATFPRLGASDAYRQTFVDEAVDELNVVSLHTADGAEAERAIARLTSHPQLVVRLLDARGAPVAGRSGR